MICDIRWAPDRYTFVYKVVPDETTRIHVQGTKISLFLYKGVKTNVYGETEDEAYECENLISH